MTLSDTERALEILRDAEEVFSAREYLLCLSKELNIPVSRAKHIVKTLVDHQEITYEEIYGSTVVGISFARPVKVTEHFFIKPPYLESQANSQEMDINIFPGISFGAGNHPTTRLSLMGIDWLFSSGEVPQHLDLTGDIGTGTGVLAIAMCLCGARQCHAWDIDAIAVAEARKNIQANALSERITVTHGGISPDRTQFSIICANLRLPTLKQLAPAMGHRILPRGFLIASGILREEEKNLVDWYRQAGFSAVWAGREKKWAGVIFQNTARLPFPIAENQRHE